ncbi:hypothetical protein DSC45_27620 [Streptomyces sp. YIM 130001]|uniref:hypothetical protein n=1 Tax=Streptomyces sp. YIM 130001 TaxID=2259644 RepID=UPI000E64F04C|nr:hypothetical protein [Streptomyces sp. YIM 130001]RII11683.1 hypothetical protein DSC45_27620 [Streptomyces sp. YIM 130001]
MPSRPSLLYVTDPVYPAQGRRYGDEDILLSSRLRTDFRIALCHPLDATSLMDRFDAVVVRNSGPVLHYQDQYEDFRTRATAHGVRVYNPLTGRADMAGKQYLLDLTRDGHPVIPTVESPQDLHRLPEAAQYAVKPKAGADSVGLSFVTRRELADRAQAAPAPEGLVQGPDLLIQPRIDFRYEVSFVYVDHTFQYAVHAPDPDRRWALEPYAPTDADLAFARRFIEWNGLDHGIQRVDACRTRDGDLLLVELEDLNPYLSLDRIDDPTRDAFVDALKTSLHRFLGAGEG